MIKYACLFFLSLGPLLSFADVCGSIIPGAAFGPYTSQWGTGYDADGYCHMRDVSESYCRQQTGGLFYQYSPDHGAGFKDCIFNRPQPQSSSGPSPSETRQRRESNEAAEIEHQQRLRESEEIAEISRKLNLQECLTADQAFQDAVESLPLGASQAKVRGSLEGYLGTIQKFCPVSGYRNKVTYALMKYNELMNAPAVETPPVQKKKIATAPAPVPPPVSVQGARCAGNYQATAWCRSDVAPFRQAKGCFAAPEQDAENDYSLSVNLNCLKSSYWASVATFDDDGVCTQAVVHVSPADHWFPQFTSSTSSTSPHVLDAIEGDSEDIGRCYMDRHNGCPCN